MSIKDTPTRYGWISIALHWLTTIAIVALLFVGSSIGTLEGDARSDTVALHTSIAAVSYVFLWARIVWRFAYGHPGPLPGQRGGSFRLGKWVHLITLVALTLMLVTGPIMAWAGGIEMTVFDWFVIRSLDPPQLALSDFMHTIHAASAVVVFIGILLHLGGVYKHVAFHRDGTFSKMLVAGKRSD